MELQVIFFKKETNQIVYSVLNTSRIYEIKNQIMDTCLIKLGPDN